MTSCGKIVDIQKAVLVSNDILALRVIKELHSTATNVGDKKLVKVSLQIYGIHLCDHLRIKNCKFHSFIVLRILF